MNDNSSNNNINNYSRLEVEVQTLREENEVLRFHLASLQASSSSRKSHNNNNYNDDNDNNDDESVFSLRQKLGNVEAEATQTVQDFNTLIEEHERLLEFVNSKQRNINRNNNGTSSRADEIMTSTSNLIQNKLQRSSGNPKQHSIDTSSPTASAAELNNLRTQLVTATSEADRHRASWEHSRRIADERGTKIRELERKLAEMNNVVHDAVTTAQQYQHQFEEFQHHLQEEKQEEKEEKSSSSSPNTNTNANASSKPDNNNNGANSYNNSVNKLNKQIEKANAAKSALASLQEQFEHQRQVTDNLNEKLAKSEGECQHLTEELLRSQTESTRSRDQLRKQTEEFIQYKHDFERVSARVSVLVGDNTVLKEENDSVRDKFRQLQEDFDVFRAHMGKVTHQRDTQAREIQQLRNEIFQLKKVSAANQALVTAAWRAMPSGSKHTSKSNVDNINNTSQQQQEEEEQQEGELRKDTNNSNRTVVVDKENSKTQNKTATTTTNDTSSGLSKIKNHQQEPSPEARQMARALVSAALGGTTNNNNNNSQSKKTPNTSFLQSNNNNNANTSEILAVSPETPSSTSKKRK